MGELKELLPDLYSIRANIPFTGGRFARKQVKELIDRLEKYHFPDVGKMIGNERKRILERFLKYRKSLGWKNIPDWIVKVVTDEN